MRLAARFVAIGLSANCARPAEDPRPPEELGEAPQVSRAPDPESTLPDTVPTGTEGWTSYEACVPTGVSALAVWGATGCALCGDASVFCWPLLRRSVQNSAVPRPGVVSLPERAAEVMASDGFACARLVDSTVACWGRNLEGRLGCAAPAVWCSEEDCSRRGRGYSDRDLSRLPFEPGLVFTAPCRVGGVRGAQGIGLGYSGGCAVVSGQLRCWGEAEYWSCAGEKFAWTSCRPSRPLTNVSAIVFRDGPSYEFSALVLLREGTTLVRHTMPQYWSESFPRPPLKFAPDSRGKAPRMVALSRTRWGHESALAEDGGVWDVGSGPSSDASSLRLVRRMTLPPSRSYVAGLGRCSYQVGEVAGWRCRPDEDVRSSFWVDVLRAAPAGLGDLLSAGLGTVCTGEAGATVVRCGFDEP